MNLAENDLRDFLMVQVHRICYVFRKAILPEQQRPESSFDRFKR